MLRSKSRWMVAACDQEKIETLVNGLKITPLVASMLINRGFDTLESARSFLFCNEPFHDPFLFKEMNKAVDRIRQAIDGGEAILIYGDYDADGVSSTTVLMKTLRDLGANVQFFIPNRFREGYGPNEQAFRRAAENGIKLIITCDNGIAGVHEAEVAKELGVDLIITDHHEFAPEIPDAFAIIHPKFPGSHYPFHELAGVGVAFKLAQALYGRVPEHLLEIAVIGTIADVVSLTGENRVITKKGLEMMKETENIGLKAIFKRAGVKLSSITEETIGFALAPRINAVGRLEDADLAVNLLLTDDPEEAEYLAEQMDDLNKQRQSLVNTITAEAIEEVETHFPADENKVLVIGKQGWHPGVIGIVASRLVDKYYRPTIILNYDRETGLAKGSARSISGYNLFENLATCRDILPAFGGHPMAAGMTLKIEDVEELRTRLNKLADEQLTAEDFIPVTMVDACIDASAVDLRTLEEMNRLAPFGMGNPKPKVLIKDVQIANMRKIGSDQSHLKLTVAESGSSLDGVGFGLGSLADQISPLANVSLIGELSINEWNNIRKPQIFIHDLAVRAWQLFDYRGRNQITHLLEAVPKENRKCIVFHEDLYEKLLPFEKENTVFIQSLEDAKSLDIFMANVVFVDLPPAVDMIRELVNGKLPARIYAYFYKPSSDFFSTMPTREHFKWFYAFLLRQGTVDIKKYGDAIAKRRGWSKETIFFMTKVFYELNFVTINDGLVTIMKQTQKRNLADSRTYHLKQEQSVLERKFLLSSFQQLKDWFDSLIHEPVKNEEAINAWI